MKKYILLFLMTCVSFCTAGIKYVDASKTAGLNDGTSWLNAYVSFQSALNASVSGDAIWVARGMYFPSQAYTGGKPSKTQNHFRMKHGVQIYGGFAGTETAIDQRTDFGLGQTNQTTFSGDIGTSGVNSDNCFHVFYHPSGLGLTSSDTLNGFVITAGNAVGAAPYDAGGGMYNVSNSPSLINITFINNAAINGGGLCESASSSTLVNVVICNNSSSSNGGGLYAVSSSATTMTNVTISNNLAQLGGGLFSTASSPTFRNCILWGNKASVSPFGHQCYVPDGTTTVQYSCFSNGTNDVFGTLTATDHIISGDPQLVDTANHDYRIAVSSPCMDAGNNSYNRELYDIRGFGFSRFADKTTGASGTIDMGAYEWVLGSTVYVNANAIGNNSGTSWTNAYTSLQAALSTAISGVQIWVAKGTYKPSSSYDLTNSPRYFHFRMKHGVRLVGGFAGTETAENLRTNYGPGEMNATILSGDLNDNGKDDNDCYHVLYMPSGIGLTNADTLNSFVISGGYANGTSPHVNGAGIYISGMSPAFVNVAVMDNKSSFGGAGLFLTNCSSTFINVLICYDSSGTNGGGVNTNYGHPTFINCTVTANQSVNGGGLYIYGDGSNVLLQNCIVWGNHAGTSGNQFVFSTGSTSATLQYSCYSNGTNDMVRQSGTGSFTTIDHNVTTDPDFKLPLSRDFRLRESSLSRNTGNTVFNSIVTDIRGQARKVSSTIDMGAYQFTSAVDNYLVILYVDASKTSGGNNGLNWANAFTSLQSALNVADPGTVIWLAKGTYKPNYDYGLGGGTRYYHFRMVHGVSICGGFAGTETALSQRVNNGPGGVNETILSGNIGNPNDSSDNCYHVFYHPANVGLMSADSITDVTITGGNANGAVPHNRGGGLFNYSSSPTLKNVRFSNNSATTSGGGIFDSSSSPTLITVMMTNNMASNGGGMYNMTSSSPIITNGVFTSNLATNGGGMCNMSSSSPIITNGVFTSNSATNGGGIYNSSSSPIITNGWFNANRATNGGGMYNTSSSPQITNSTIVGSKAVNGGGIYNYISSPTITDVNFRFDSAALGGALYNSTTSNPSISYGMITNNNASSSGGGIYNMLSSNPTVANIQITYNTALMGGGMCNTTNSSPVITGAIFYGNSATIGGAMYNATSSVASKHVWYIQNKASSFGGGIYNLSSGFISENDTIAQNTADNGGGMYDVASDPILVNVAIMQNSADSLGGGIYDTASTSTVTNGLIVNNWAKNGGGIYSKKRSSLDLSNVTISNNSAGVGGGIYSTDATDGILENCILWGNGASTSGKQMYIANTGWFTLHYSCYSDGTNDITISGGMFTATDSNITSDPLFADTSQKDYRILGASPCVDHGNTIYNVLTKDFGGRSRIQHDSIDMGAYEFHPDTDPPGRIIFVDASKTTGLNTGMSWTNAFTSLHSALKVAAPGTSIWIAKGTYRPSSSFELPDSSRYFHFRILHGVPMYGGFAGTESSLSQRTNWGPGQTNETVLSGDIGSQGDSTDNCYHVFYHSGATELTVADTLNGVTIEGGNANGLPPHDNGGGIYNYGNSSPTLINVAIRKNSAKSGGGMYNYLSWPTLSNVVINGNTATNGGGIFDVRSAPTLTNTTIAGNSAITGGGVYESSSMTVQNSIIWGNTAASNGKQVFVTDGGSVTLHYSCYSNGTNDIGVSSGWVAASDHNITANPLFVDSAHYEFRLSRTSPCINTGSNGYISAATDMRGIVRIQNGSVDMGAYEYAPGYDDPIYVDSSRTQGLNTGVNWANAYTSLQSALNSAIPGATIWIAKGTYKPSSSYDLPASPRYFHFRMIHGVSVYGGFAGTETALNQRTNYKAGGINETILSGDIGVQGADSDNCYHVLYHPNGTGLTSTDTLSSVTIKGGNANGGYPHYSGGGMYNVASSPTLSTVTIRNNLAYSSGGGIYDTSSSPRLTNVTISKNSAPFGAGLYNNSYSSPILISVAISNNAASSNGGGLYNYSYSSPILTNVTICNNVSVSGGGMFNNLNSSPTLRNCVVWGNTATTGGRQFYISNGGTTSLSYGCYSNGTNDVIIAGGAFDATSHNITIDPQFVDSTHGDYRLLGTSPCVDAGNNSYDTVLTDLRGEPRIQNSVIDMGAYEYQTDTDPLPIELQSFTALAKKNSVLLQWKTVTEVNNAGFEVQRCVAREQPTEKQWSAVRFVEGGGTVNTPKEYSYNDLQLAIGKYSYRLKQIDHDGAKKYSKEIEVEIGSAPKVFVLEQNYPNPFNPSTTIQFTLERSGITTLKIYDAIGREVAVVVNEFLEAGQYYQRTFNASHFASGVYFARLQSGDRVQLKKMLLLK